MGLLIFFFLFLSACSKQGPAGPSLTAVLPSIAGGGAHSCSLNQKGALDCWGRNESGQLGIQESEIESLSLKPMSILDFKSIDQTSDEDLIVDQVVAGQAHSCIRTRSGKAKCWGQNSAGQLGNQSVVSSNRPVAVVGLEASVIQLASGLAHVCALLNSGSVQCWGYNGFGQLGNASKINSLVPLTVPNLAAAISIAAGNHHTCAVLVSGAVQCWGLNQYGQLGNGTRTDQLTPVAVTGLDSGVRSIFAGGEHSCAILNATGTIKCWGRNSFGQLGTGQVSLAQLSPADVSGITGGALNISLGQAHTCAQIGGGIQCWGANNFGQLGNNLFADSAIPVAVSGLDAGVAGIGAGKNHSCAITSDDRLKCWGANDSGQLGDGTTEMRVSPQNVFGR